MNNKKLNFVLLILNSRWIIIEYIDVWFVKKNSCVNVMVYEILFYKIIGWLIVNVNFGVFIFLVFNIIFSGELLCSFLFLVMLLGLKY